MEKRGYKIGIAICMVCLFLFGMCVMYILCSDKTASDKVLALVLCGMYILLTVIMEVFFSHEIVKYETEAAIKRKSDEEYLATLEAANETYKQSIDELMDEIRSLRTQLEDSSKDEHVKHAGRDM